MVLSAVGDLLWCSMVSALVAVCSVISTGEDPEPVSSLGTSSCQRDYTVTCPEGFVEFGQSRQCVAGPRYRGPCTGALYSFAETDTYFLSKEQPSFPINDSTAQLAMFVEEVASSLAHDQQTLSLGWRWDLRENLAFKVQLERTDVEARGTGLRARDGLVVDDEDGVVHTLFLALSFSF